MLRIDYFTASWCGPCKTFKPVMLKVTDEMGVDLSIWDVDINPEKSSGYQVMSVPTSIIWKDDVIVDTIVGAFPEPRLRERLDRLLA